MESGSVLTKIYVEYDVLHQMCIGARKLEALILYTVSI